MSPFQVSRPGPDDKASRLGGLARIPISFPDLQLAEDFDPRVVAEAFALRLSSVRDKTVTSKVPLFPHPDLADNAIWRDSFALTGSFNTFYSAPSLIPVLQKCSELRRAKLPEAVKVEDARVVRSPQVNSSWVEATFKFTTEAPNCCNEMLVWLSPEDSLGPKAPLSSEEQQTTNGDSTFQHSNGLGSNGNTQEEGGILLDGRRWKIWCLMTVLSGVQERSENGNAHIDTLHLEQETRPLEETFALIIGAGPSGLSMSSNLHRQGVPHLLLDANQQIGDNWMNRYHSARLHTTRHYSHLPYNRTFSEEKGYPDWLGRESLAKGYKEYVDEMGLEKYLRMGAKVVGGSQDEHGVWCVEVQNIQTEMQWTVKCREIVLCVGAGGQEARVPEIDGMQSYKGIVMHSVDFKTAAQLPPHPITGRPIKTAIVVGSGNTGHDLAEDLVDAGVETTMLQRSPTFVIPVPWYQAGTDRNYNTSIPTELSDLRAFSQPNAIYSRLVNAGVNGMIAQRPEAFDDLEKAGFRVQRKGDMGETLYERAGGHYLDTGASARISKGDIAVLNVSRGWSFGENGIQYADGMVQRKVQADAVVFATGFFGDARQEVRRLFGSKTANRCSAYWGVDGAGEIQGAWVPQEQKGLWMCGGTLGLMRWGSRMVGASLTASFRGHAIPVFGRDFVV